MKPRALIAALATSLILVPAVQARRAAPAPVSPAPPQAAARAAPKLIIAIAVDQFSADLFAEYRSHFSGGLARLAGGVVFPSGYQSHAATETCPGHSTILTGSRPARTGIVANSWFDFSIARGDKKIYCAEDESVEGSSSEKYTVSDVHLRVPTLGDRMKTADPRSRVVSVAGKDRAAVMLGGHKTDQIWWWGSAGFTSYAGRAEPASVSRINTRLDDELSAATPAPALPALCSTRVRPIAILPDASVGDAFAARGAGDRRAFRARPDFDAATLELATGLLDELRLGAGDTTDLLTIGLSATDYVGHSYGTEGPEMCQQLLALDTMLGDFLKTVDARGISYAVVLTADHGGHDLPERNHQHAIPEAARVTTDVMPSAIDVRVTKALGLEGFFIGGDSPFGDFYVARDIPEDQRAKVITEAVATLRALPQVAMVLTRADIAAAPKPDLPPEAWTLAQRAAANFDRERSGDLYVILKPRITPIPDGSGGYVATHGSAWDYDRRVPMLFWWPEISPFEQPNSVETVDILPTLASLIGLGIPAGEIDGRCLDLDASAATSCR